MYGTNFYREKIFEYLPWYAWHYIQLSKLKYTHILKNVKFVGDLPFSIYFDFETTAGKKVYHFDKDATLFPASCALVTTSLNIDKIFVVRSFNHKFDQLNDAGYLSSEILPYCVPWLCDSWETALRLFSKRGKFSLSKMFSCELEFVINLIRNRLAEKHFWQYREINFCCQAKIKDWKPNKLEWNKMLDLQFSPTYVSICFPQQKNNNVFRLCHISRACFH